MSEIVLLKNEISERNHIKGTTDAPVVIVEYGDLECLHSMQAYEVLGELKDRLGTQFGYVFRHFPLEQHPNAFLAAEAAEAAGA